MGHQRKMEEHRRLRKVYIETRHSYGAGVYFYERKNRYVRYSVGSQRSRGKYLRNVANRKVRRSNNPSNHGGYRKVYDYWWELL